MARTEPSKEATLREVLAEISIVDLLRMLKKDLARIGCWGLFMVVIALVSAVVTGTKADVESWGIPGWVVWIFLGWGYAYAMTESHSYHTLEISWYFPKLGWFWSLVFAAYAVGFVELVFWVGSMEVGWDRTVAAIAVWLGYTFAMIFFLSAINAGHAKLMEKRASVQADE